MVWGQENVWLVTLLGGAAFVSSVLYMLGGTQGFGLFMRRFIASFVLAAAVSVGAVVLGNWTWYYLLFFPSLAAGFSLGYKSDTLIGKILRRTLFALGVVACGVFGALAHHFSGPSIVILGLSLFTGLGSVVLGAFNPYTNAPVEQFIICQLLTAYTVFWAFVR